jgi:hypothetical protein
LSDQKASTIAKVLIGYSSSSAELKRRVLELANRLRQDGINCECVDLIPEEQETRVGESDIAAIICIGVKKIEVRWEEHINNTRWIFGKNEGFSDIPHQLRGLKCYFVDTEKGYNNLYRYLINQQQVRFVPWINKWHPL